VEYKLTGSFEVLNEENISTDAGTFNVFVIEYNIFTTDFVTRARDIWDYETDEPPEEYGDISVPGGDSNLVLVGGGEGSGKSYVDTTTGRPEKIEDGSSYFSETYSSMDPTLIENSYDNLAGPSNFGDEKSDDNDSGSFPILYVVAAIAAVLIIVFIVILFFVKKRMKQQLEQQRSYGQPAQDQNPQNQYQYPSQFNSTPQQPEQQQYPQQPYPTQQPPQPPQQNMQSSYYQQPQQPNQPYPNPTQPQPQQPTQQQPPGYQY
jgi:hypothetical protein